MRQQHSPTTISSQSQLIQSVAFRVISLQEGQVGVPLVSITLPQVKQRTGIIISEVK